MFQLDLLPTVSHVPSTPGHCFSSQKGPLIKGAGDPKLEGEKPTFERDRHIFKKREKELGLGAEGASQV